MFLGGDREKKRNVCFVVEVDEEVFMMCWYFIEKKKRENKRHVSVGTMCVLG
jgi:hypothetical protein